MMTTTHASPLDTSPAGPDWSRFRSSPFDLLLLFGLIGLLPLVLVEAAHLWSRPHFQFFPIAWGAFAWLVYSRGALGTTSSPYRLWCGTALMGLSWASAVLAVLWFSPWLAHLALTMLLLSWMLVRLGPTVWYLPLAWITLLLVSLPLPMNYDTRLVQSLQSASSSSASALLDLSSVPHLAQGNVIEIRTGKLFVDEACSGVDSLYALAAVGLLITIWYGKNLLISLLALATVPAWAWFGNLVRIYTIAFVFDRFEIDWTHGWQHMLLGLVIFALLVTCFLMTIEALTIFLSPFPAKTVTSGPLHTLFNRVVCWPKSDPTARTRKPSAPRAVTGLIVPPRLQQVVRVMGFLFLVIGFASLFPVMGVGPWKEPGLARGISDQSIEAQFPAEALPESLGGLRQTGFEVHHRERDSFFGEHSATWQYAGRDFQVMISLDMPFPDYHGLEQCYELSGSERVEAVQEHIVGSGTESDIIYDTAFIDQLGEESYLCYTEFDASGQTASRDALLERGIFRNSAGRVLFQLQIYATGIELPSEEERARYRELLLELKELLLPRIQAIGE